MAVTGVDLDNIGCVTNTLHSAGKMLSFL